MVRASRLAAVQPRSVIVKIFLEPKETLMKTVLTVAAVAALTFTATPPAQAGNPNKTEASHEIRQRETRHQRDERLRKAHRRSSETQRETRHQREAQLRDLGQDSGLEIWRDMI
jgi:mannitol-specific phosphotransferase system IIBC component